MVTKNKFGIIWTSYENISYISYLLSVNRLVRCKTRVGERFCKSKARSIVPECVIRQYVVDFIRVNDILSWTSSGTSNLDHYSIILQRVQSEYRPTLVVTCFMLRYDGLTSHLVNTKRYFEEEKVVFFAP